MSLTATDTNAWWQSSYRRPLVDLGVANDSRLAGIWTPTYSEEELARFMSPHYNSDAGAEGQVNDFDLVSYYDGQLSIGLKGVHIPADATILELGCGFGSATFPLLRLYPESRIVASELSVPMLYELKKKLQRGGQADRCSLLQLNAEELDFADNTFDVVAGAAILHHLFEPKVCLSQVAHVLKPGGVAVFFEPFMPGYSILHLMYDEVIRHPQFKTLPSAVKQYFQHSVWVWKKMANIDKSDKFFQGTDDKWIFPKAYFHELAGPCGFSRCIVKSMHDVNAMFKGVAESHLSGNKISVPKWVRQTIDRYEECLSADQKRDLLTEGCIILQK